MTSNRPTAVSAGVSIGSWLLSLLILAPQLNAQEIHDPELFEKSAKAAVEAVKVYKASDDRAEIERVNRIGYAIARSSGFTKFPFSFFVVDMAIPNAFALPAGHIFVTRGMLDLDLDDDMLAAVLGHEIAHVTQEHFLKMKHRAALLNVLSGVLTVGAMVGASRGGDSDIYYDQLGNPHGSNNAAALAQGIAMGGMVMTEMLLRSYSRGNEDEADYEGQRFAAGAGFDPQGTRRLMAKMESRLPQTQSFGYWQTHPFFEERVRAAKARQSTLQILEARSADDYRQATQSSLLDFLLQQAPPPEVETLVKDTALRAWPAGPSAETLRWEKLHQLRQDLAEQDELERDYRPVLEAYEKHRGVVAELTPQSPFLAAIGDEVVELRAELEVIYPKALLVLDGEVRQTPFLSVFLSNFPDSERASEVALVLGEAYARTARETEAVRSFLRARRSDPSSVQADKAGRGLRALAPRLQRLAALQELADQRQDPDLRELAANRLSGMVSSYEDLENGADFLERFPDSEHVAAVTERQNKIADEIYKEVILYQQVGDNARAVEGIHQILTWAPFSDAASRLTSNDILEG